MTTIAYRNGVMAADSATSANGTTIGYTTKLAKNPSGDVCGGAGITAICATFRKWFEGGETGEMPNLGKDDDEDAVFLVARVSGEIQFYSRLGVSTLCNTEYAAEGSGTSVALGAMHAGASSYDAVRAAAHHDTRTGGPIQTLRLGRD